MIPNEDSYCDIDPDVVDKWGIPVLRFHWKWSDHEVRQVEAHAGDLPLRSSTSMGGSVLDPMPGPDQSYGISKGGEIIHEVGTTRMGDEPAHLGAERVLPGPRREEPLRGRRRALRLERPQERDLDHPGPGLADQRVHSP